MLRQSDIVVTNPPFSLFKEYLPQLIEFEKEFLVLGSIGAIQYKKIWFFFLQNRVWLGHSSNKSLEFGIPNWYPLTGTNSRTDKNNNKFVKVPGITWFTNLEHDKRNEEPPLWKEFTPEEYPKYDNYAAIEVGEIAEIPMDYYGEMGVPITFLGKHNPDQFDLIGIDTDLCGNRFYLQGKRLYTRIVIKRKT